MDLNDLNDDPEDPQHTPQERAESSLVVGVGIIGNLAGYPILDPIAALIVGFMVAKMGWASVGRPCTT